MRMSNSSLPVLALDVDGPLALMGDPACSEVIERSVDGIPVIFETALPARLQLLSTHFRIIWSSSWGKRASAKIAPLLGLPAGLPYIDFGKFPRARAGVSHKLPGLKGWLRNMPAAIVDDEVGEDLIAWASERPHTLVLEIDPRFGLQDKHVNQLLEFAGSLRA